MIRVAGILIIAVGVLILRGRLDLTGWFNKARRGCRRQVSLHH